MLVLIRDAGSTNGTYLNGDQIGTEELQEGDRITLGRTTMTFHLEQAR
ncbi:FHA domain-containing protein [Ornithinimicrobium sp. INDO-MA30-4]|nr:FHA domain-containing protein [Ornithinimicrobium sp. INDO-MA30-4]